jgi:hypothetical protein
MSTQITLTLPGKAGARLRNDYEHFVKVSTGLDKHFVAPTFEEFLCAAMLNHDAPLTERAVSRLLAGGEYGWAKRVFDKQMPLGLSHLIKDAARFGFALVTRPEWTPQERTEKAREWAAEILAQAGGDPDMADMLAEQIAAAATDVRVVETEMETPAWRLADSLRKRSYDLLYLIQTEQAMPAALSRLGELRATLGLALEYGSVDAGEASRVLEQVERARPDLFSPTPDDWLARLAAWLRQFFNAAPSAKVNPDNL